MPHCEFPILFRAPNIFLAFSILAFQWISNSSWSSRIIASHLIHFLSVPLPCFAPLSGSISLLVFPLVVIPFPLPPLSVPCSPCLLVLQLSCPLLTFPLFLCLSFSSRIFRGVCRPHMMADQCLLPVPILFAFPSPPGWEPSR